MHDRVGLSWQPQLARGILDHLDEIDALEVIASARWDELSAQERRALRWLARERPVVLHGVDLGLASSFPVDARRLADFARFADGLRPQSWSEHLAFARAGGVEIGHFACPPRTAATVDGTVRNVERAARALGSRPALENIAHFIEPPASAMTEWAWTRAILERSGASLLLDLYNLYANV